MLAVLVVTADTHGTVAGLLRDCADLEIARIEVGNEAEQKFDLLEKLGASHPG
jgi:soluble P-type ATPase